MKNKINISRKLTALLLLVVITSHLFVFHFELETKFLCIGEGNHFHIEKIENDIVQRRSISSDNKCTDIALDNHVDEDYAKTSKIVIYKTVQSINLKLKESQKILTGITDTLVVNKFITEHLPTTLLLI